MKESDKDVYCDMCDSSISVSNMSPSNCFVILDPSTEISNLVQDHQDYYNDVINKRLNKSNDIQDIYNGQYYQMFVNSLPANSRNQYVTA